MISVQVWPSPKCPYVYIYLYDPLYMNRVFFYIIGYCTVLPAVIFTLVRRDIKN